MKVLSLFTGIGAFEKALQNIGIEYELVGFSEIDKYAVKSYCAIHNINESFNLGDITKIDINKLPLDIDLITHGSPCQDFSAAGKGAGGEQYSGTRSSLMWNTVEIVKYCKSKYVVWENVKNLLSKKHRHNFDGYLKIMEELGYNNYYQVLNAKDYGIPQNRERIYTISIRKDIDDNIFCFSKKENINIKLKDMLENEVDEKYYISDEKIQKIKNSTYNTTRRMIQEKDYCDTLCARDWKDPKCIQIGELDMKDHDSMKRVYSDEGLRFFKDNVCGSLRTIDSCGDKRIIENYSEYLLKKYVDEPKLRVRKLTPLECWRLMGFTDEDFYKAQATGMSNSQLYKQAGNSIVVNVLEEIFKNLLKENCNDRK